MLSALDRLYIVHVWREGKHRERERWSTGGPLLRGLDVALANYRHTVVELEVRAGRRGQRCCCLRALPAEGFACRHVELMQLEGCLLVWSALALLAAGS